MYLSQVPLWLIVATSSPENEDIQGILFIPCVLLLLGAFIVSIIYTIRCASLKEEPPFKATLIAKLILIPWIGLNALVSYFLMEMEVETNVLLIFFCAIIVILAIGISYIFVIITSVPNIICGPKYLKKNNIKSSVGFVFTIFLHFFVVLDIIGAIILNSKYKKLLANNNSVETSKEGE